MDEFDSGDAGPCRYRPICRFLAGNGRPPAEMTSRSVRPVRPFPRGFFVRLRSFASLGVVPLAFVAALGPAAVRAAPFDPVNARLDAVKGCDPIDPAVCL